MAERLRKGAEDRERQRVLAGMESARQQGLHRQRVDSRRPEEVARRTEEGEARASGSKRKRGITDDEDDDEYEPNTESTEMEDRMSCYNCRTKNIKCERTG